MISLLSSMGFRLLKFTSRKNPSDKEDHRRLIVSNTLICLKHLKNIDERTKLEVDKAKSYQELEKTFNEIQSKLSDGKFLNYPREAWLQWLEELGQKELVEQLRDPDDSYITQPIDEVVKLAERLQAEMEVCKPATSGEQIDSVVYYLAGLSIAIKQASYYLREYHISNDYSKQLIAEMFDFSKEEAKVLAANKEVNISDRLGIEGMLMTLEFQIGIIFLTIKIDGVKIALNSRELDLNSLAAECLSYVQRMRLEELQLKELLKRSKICEEYMSQIVTSLLYSELEKKLQSLGLDGGSSELSDRNKGREEDIDH